jgi:hypothetical protein
MSETPTRYATISAVALLLATVSLLAAITTRTTVLPETAADASKITIEVVAEH